MSRPARSLFAFGIYVALAGTGFLAAPGAILRILALPPATVGWARMIGLLALVIGAYDIVAARAESLPYIKASVWVRFGFAAGVVLLVATRQMPPTILPLAALDTAGAVWTALSLRGGSHAT